jgi:hypothetical protein
MNILKLVIGIILGVLSISMLKVKKIDSKLNKPVMLVIGLAVGASVYCVLTLVGL